MHKQSEEFWGIVEKLFIFLKKIINEFDQL